METVSYFFTRLDSRQLRRVMTMAVCALFSSLCSCQIDPLRPDSSSLSQTILNVQLVPCRVESSEVREYITGVYNHINLFRTANGKAELPLNQVLSAAMMQSAFYAEQIQSLDSSNFSNQFNTYIQENNCDIDPNWAAAYELPAYVESGRNVGTIGSDTLKYWTTDQTSFTSQYREILLRDDIVSIGVGFSFDKQNAGGVYVKLIGVSQAQ